MNAEITGSKQDTAQPLEAFSSVFEKVALFALVTWSSIMAYQMAASGIRHDYAAYVEQWSHVLAGGDPWVLSGIPFNAYGPVHTFLAFSAIPSFLVPKFIFGLGIIWLNLILVMLLLKATPRPRLHIWVAYLLLIPLNFLVIGAVFLFGNNDALVAALIGFGVLARFRGFAVTAGMLFGLAILLKFYPLLLLPFLTLHDRRFNLRVLASALGVVLIGFTITTLRWGTSFINAISGGIEREATILSILNYLREAGISEGTYEALLGINTIAVVLMTGALFLVVWLFRIHWLVGASIAMLLLATVYKVGHQQFLLTWLVLLACLLVMGPRSTRPAVFIAMPLVLGLSAFQYGFVQAWNEGVFWDEPGTFLRVTASLIFFILSAITIVTSLLMSIHQNHTSRALAEPSAPKQAATL